MVRDGPAHAGTRRKAVQEGSPAGEGHDKFAFMFSFAKRPALVVLAASLGACGFFPGSDGNAPTIGVTMRGGGSTVSMGACHVADGPVELTISLYDSDGLKAARVDFSGVIGAAGVQMNPGGQDIVMTEGGMPGQEQVSVTFSPVVAGQVRTSAVLSFVTDAPFTGSLGVTATDQRGKTARAGPFRLAKPGGC